jgi:endonuclease YncB( thermonuclease family)
MLALPFAVLVAASLTGRASASEISMHVAVDQVLNGDTFEVVWSGARQRVRVAGVDSPELGQSFGEQARQFTRNLLASQTVRIDHKGNDDYGYIVARVFLPDGTDVSSALVRAGMAWCWREGHVEERLKDLQERARSRREGLWSENRPEPPWVYRRRNGDPREEWRLIKEQERLADHDIRRRELQEEEMQFRSELMTWAQLASGRMKKIEVALSGYLGATHNHEPVGEHCRRLSLAITEASVDGKLFSAPDRLINYHMRRAVGELATLSRQCIQWGSTVHLNTHVEVARAALDDVDQIVRGHGVVFR